ncbi:MAG: DUF3987 domain-containing protein [Gammaproteobacteria bacterium]
MTHHATEDFRAAIAAAGIDPPETIEPDGVLHRYPTNGTRGDDSGWYVYHDDGIPAGAYGDWRNGVSNTWCGRSPSELSPAERNAHRRCMQAIERERNAEREHIRAQARERAAEIWRDARPETGEHRYLRDRGVQAHGIRSDGLRLVIPMRDTAGTLRSIQYIDPRGDKRYLAGGRVAGCYHAIGKPDGLLCISEGYATAASIHEATGYAVAVAFSAGNLTPVARALRTKYPDLPIIVCADDDCRTEGNPGITKATAAARAVNGLLAVPGFGDERPDDATDFNDLAQHRGAEAVRHAIASATLPVVEYAKAENAVEAWPDPQPIQATLPAVPTFDADTLLPQTLRPWIMDEADRMPCPPDFIASAALVALGSIIGARCAIKPKTRDDWLVVPNLWGGVVGPPSTKKTPSMNSGLKPMGRLIAAAQAAHQAEMEAFETDKTVFDARDKAIEKRIEQAARDAKKGNVDDLAMELQNHRRQAPKAPVKRRYKSNDTTIEKLGELLKQNPAGLLVARDELVGLLASWDRQGREGDREFYLESWNGCNDFNTDRIGRGSIDIPNLCVSIFGGIQPDRLTGYLEQAAHALANDGLLQRFQVLVYPDPIAWTWRDRIPDRHARDRAFEVFETLADFDPVAWGAAPASPFAKFPHFQFDEAAQAVFVEWCADLYHNRLANEEHPIIQQHLAKYEKLFTALALIFHLVECAASKQRGKVTEQAALRAAAWCEYLEAHARRCYGLLMDDGLRAAQALATKVNQGKLPDKFTARDVRRNRWRYLTTGDAVRAALDWLEDEGWLRGFCDNKGQASGKSSWCYEINPKILQMSKQGAANADVSD